MSLIDVCARAESDAELSWALQEVDPDEAEYLELLRDFLLGAHDAQHPPTPVTRDDWAVWLLLGGRGAGKTRSGAEWVRGVVRGDPGYSERKLNRLALVGETYGDVRDVMVEGSSGIIEVHRRDRWAELPRWSPSLRRLDWPSGAVAQTFSSDDPDGLRGPQFEGAWCDELAKWRNPDATWNNLQLGLRLGDWPRAVVTTTPRPTGLLRRLLGDPATALSRLRTAENAKYLSPLFIQRMERQFAGTRLGRQELEGELVDERDGALWSREALETGRAAAAPDLIRIVVAVDPPASSGERADACGIVAAGLDAGGAGWVLADASLQGAAPPAWAERAIATYRHWGADALLAEANNGGEMVRSVLAQVDPGVPVRLVHASRGKHARAEPVATLYHQRRVHHVGAFPDLEDEMCAFTAAGLPGGRSPDRLDALVWALSELMLTGREPRVRVV